MKTIIKYLGKAIKPSEADFFKRFWDESFTHIKTVVDVLREPVLILDKDLRVLAANETFYRTFYAKIKDTENRIVYELGNGQWDIPELRQLLEDILPQHTFFKGFQVAHSFPLIGRKVMILNARQIFIGGDAVSKHFPPIILLAMEDITDMMMVADQLAERTNEVEARFSTRSQKVEKYVAKLEKEIIELKKVQKTYKRKGNSRSNIS